MIVVLNGPNLNLTGTRAPEIYGAETLESCFSKLRDEFPQVVILDLQSNYEGELIGWLQKYGRDEMVKGILINPGALAHYSYAVADAIRDCLRPVIEIHISNIFGREEFRRVSVTAPACQGVISGFGLAGYRLGVVQVLSQSEEG